MCQSNAPNCMQSPSPLHPPCPQFTPPGAKVHYPPPSVALSCYSETRARSKGALNLIIRNSTLRWIWLRLHTHLTTQRDDSTINVFLLIKSTIMIHYWLDFNTQTALQAECWSGDRALHNRYSKPPAGYIDTPSGAHMYHLCRNTARGGCVCVSAGACQGMVGHRSPVNVAYESKAVLFLSHFIFQILSFICHVWAVNRLVYKSYNSRSLLWANTMSKGGRPITKAHWDLPDLQSFDEKQRAEGAAGDIGSS